MALKIFVLEKNLKVKMEKEKLCKACKSFDCCL